MNTNIQLADGNYQITIRDNLFNQFNQRSIIPINHSTIISLVNRNAGFPSP